MQSLVQQITTAAKSASVRNTNRPKNWQRATEIARLKHTAAAVERYRTVMRDAGWLHQSEIEFKLGYAATVSRDFLQKLWLDLKLIERRNRHGAKSYVRKQGFEWRWKDGA